MLSRLLRMQRQQLPKLQRRANEWYVVDAESRNGTYVDGERVSGERKLSAACEVRFGGVKALFRALAGGGGQG